MATDYRSTASEAEWQDTVVAYAGIRGWLVHHCRPAAGATGRWRTHITGSPGFPDLVLARHGRVVFAELKSERGKLAREQAAWLEELVPRDPNRPVDVFVWRPSDWPEVERVLA